MEELGQLETDKQTKSVVITMPCDANLIRPNNGTPEERFAVEFSQLLSEWTNGSITSRDTSKRIEQCLQEATDNAANAQGTECAQSSEANSHNLSEKIRHDALAMVAATVFRQVLQNGVSGNEAEVASPLDDFFTIDLCGDWASFMDVARMLAEFVVNGDAHAIGDQSAESKSALMTLRQPFLAMIAEQVGGHSAQSPSIHQQ